MTTRNQAIFIILLTFVIVGQSAMIIYTLNNQAEFDKIRQNISDLSDDIQMPDSFFYVDVISHENGTLYSCEELRQKLGESLAFCDDFSDSDINATWVVLNITSIPTPTPEAHR